MLTQTGHMLSYPFTPPSMNTKAITRIIIPIRWFQFHRKPQISVATSYVEDWGAFFEVFRVVNEFKVINQVVCNKKINFLKLMIRSSLLCPLSLLWKIEENPWLIKNTHHYDEGGLRRSCYLKKSGDPLSEPVFNIW